MTSYDIQQLLTQRPFRPMQIHFLEGEMKEIGHPELAWCAGDMLFIGGGRLDNGRLVVEELDAIYGINLIKKIERIETHPAQLGGGNRNAQNPPTDA